MKKTLTTLRTMQLLAQRGHHLVQGPTFFSDHEKLQSFYEEYGDGFDSVAENMIGNGAVPDFGMVNQDAAKGSAAPSGRKPEQFFRTLLTMEEALQGAIKEEMAKATVGGQNLLQGLAMDSDRRKYLMKGRLLNPA